MNWKEYLVMSEKTMSTEFHCDSKDEKILHAVIGILTEIEELLDNHDVDKSPDEVGRNEEVIDALWYCAIISREFDIDYPQIVTKMPNEDPMGLIVKIIKNTCKLLDMLKKKLYYNRPIDENNFRTVFHLILLNFSDYANCYDINLEKSFDVNIDKLRARYGDKFSSERAINRDLETERNILEGKN
jgi:NTP pyrophosphatase (non-canonical NTP hydrolase)